MGVRGVGDLRRRVRFPFLLFFLLFIVIVSREKKGEKEINTRAPTATTLRTMTALSDGIAIRVDDDNKKK